MSRTGGSHSSLNAYRKAGELCTIIRPLLCPSNSGILFDWSNYILVRSLNARVTICKMPDLSAQSGEKLVVNVVEAAVAENYDHVFWPEHRNDSVHNCVRILFIEGRPASLGDHGNDPLWF